MTLPSFLTISRMGHQRSMRVASVTLPIGHRHVEIGPEQHALAAEIEFVEGLEAGAHDAVSGVMCCGLG